MSFCRSFSVERNIKYIYIYSFIYVFVCVCVCLYIHTYIYIHICVLSLLGNIEQKTGKLVKFVKFNVLYNFTN